jgi:alpha-tubulin suppressor-like RCC1 family protein
LDAENDAQIPSFTKVPRMRNIKSVAARQGYAVALDHDVNLWATGDNSYGQLALDEKNTYENYYFSFTIVPGAKNFAKISAAKDFLMALDKRGSL